MQRETQGSAGTSPLILAIETSTVLLGVAVVGGRDVLYQNVTQKPRVHSSMLLPMCMDALDTLGLRPGDLAAVAVSAGPGSFTGLRIGCATAQGLAAGTGLGVIMVPTFEVYLAQCAGLPRIAVVQGKAKSQTVTALYVKVPVSFPATQNGFAVRYGYVAALPPAPRGMDEFLAEMAQQAPDPVHVTGDAAVEFTSFCQTAGRNVAPGLEFSLVEENLRLPSPGVVGVVASGMFREGRIVPAGEAVPMYYRKSQPEVKAMENRPEIEIQKMTLNDLDRILEIEAQSYKTPWSRRAFTSEITENSYAHYFVARHEGKIVGYVGMWVILEEAHITNIAVDPAYRRQRVGQRMLEAMFEKAKEYGATRMTLEVRVSNYGAQNLYRKLGFVDRGTRKGYYTDTNEDAIIMWKDDLGPQKPKEDQIKWMV